MKCVSSARINHQTAMQKQNVILYYDYEVDYFICVSTGTQLRTDYHSTTWLPDNNNQSTLPYIKTRLSHSV